MHSFMRFCFFFWLYCKHYVIIPYVILRVVTALYLKVTGYDKWWLGAVPVCHHCVKRDLAGVGFGWLVPTALLAVLFFVGYSPIVLIAWFILNVICDYKFAEMYVYDYDAKLYSFIPGSKYVIMVMEVIKYVRDESG